MPKKSPNHPKKFFSWNTLSVRPFSVYYIKIASWIFQSIGVASQKKLISLNIDHKISYQPNFCKICAHSLASAENGNSNQKVSSFRTAGKHFFVFIIFENTGKGILLPGKISSNSPNFFPIKLIVGQPSERPCILANICQIVVNKQDKMSKVVLLLGFPTWRTTHFAQSSYKW